MKKVTGFKPMNETNKKRITELAKRPDSEIDTSDIPEWTKEDFAHSVPFHSLYKPRKEQVTARIDSDVLVWLKSFGRGYQTLMNELLRKEMMESKKKSSDKTVSI